MPAEAQVQDPYAEFGGSAQSDDPYAEFGGQRQADTAAPAQAKSVDPYAEFSGSVSPTDLANKELAKQGLSVQPPPNRIPRFNKNGFVRQYKSADEQADFDERRNAAAEETVRRVFNPASEMNAVIPGAGTFGAGVKDLATSGKRAQGATEMLAGTADALTPFMGPAALENPVSTAAWMGAGYGSQKAADVSLKHTNLSPETKQLLSEASFWAPQAIAAATGLAIKPVPENTAGISGGTAEILGGRVKAGAVSTPQGAGVGVKVGGTSVAVGKFDPVQEAASALGRKQLTDTMAARVQNGQPPVPPQPQAPPLGPQSLTSKHVQAIAQAINSLPEEQRPNALLEAHSNLAKWIQDRGKVVDPISGKIIIAKTPEEAEKAATDIINSAVQQHDKAAKDAEKVKAEGKSKTISASRKTAPQPAAQNAQPAAQGTPALTEQANQSVAKRLAEQAGAENAPKILEKVSGAEGGPQQQKITEGEPLIPSKEAVDGKISAQLKDEGLNATPPVKAPESAIAQIGKKEPESGRTIVQPSDSPIEAQALATEAAPELAQRLESTVKGLDGVEFARLRPQKKPERVAEKMQDEQEPVSTIGDLLAGQIVVDSLEAKEQVIAALNKQFEMAEPMDDYFDHGRDAKGGYRAASLQVKNSNGSTAEIQVVPREVYDIIERTHAHYAAARDAELAGDKETARRETAIATAMNDEAWEEFQKRNRASLERERTQPSTRAAEPAQGSEATPSGTPQRPSHPTSQAQASPPQLTTGTRVTFTQNGKQQSGEIKAVMPEMGRVAVRPDSGGRVTLKTSDVQAERKALPISEEARAAFWDHVKGKRVGHYKGAERRSPESLAARGVEATGAAAEKYGLHPTRAENEADIQKQADQIATQLGILAKSDPKLAEDIVRAHPEVREVLARGHEIASNKEAHESSGRTQGAVPEAVTGKQGAVQEPRSEAGQAGFNGAGSPAQAGVGERPEDLEALKRRLAELEAKVNGAPPKRDSSSLRKAAESLQSQIDQKRNPAIANQNPTARRARIAEGMSKDADRMERVKRKLEAIADAIDQGSLPESLSGIRSKAQLETLMATRDHMPRPGVHKHTLQEAISETLHLPGTKEARSKLNGASLRGDTYIPLYGDEEINAFDTLRKKADERGVKTTYWNTHSLDEYKRLRSAGIDTEEKFQQAKKDLAELGGEGALTNTKEQEIKSAERALIGTKIPGYFPTPKPLAERLVDEADIKPGMSVLEPSAGKGNIADAIKAAAPEAKIDTVEPSTQLSDILKLKGHNVVGRDFLEHSGEYDRIVMNPPFENGQDIDHVRRAYDLLKPGGRVVAIMSEGPFFRSDKKASEFREWLDSQGGISEKLPEGSFTGAGSERQTGVATRIVTIDKPKQAESIVAPLGPQTSLFETKKEREPDSSASDAESGNLFAQLDNAKSSNEAERVRQALNEALFRSHSGIPIDAIPAAAKYVAATIKNSDPAQNLKELITSEADKVKQSRDIQKGLYDLEGAYAADVLRAVKLFKSMPGDALDQEAIYHALEDPKIKLNDQQEFTRDVLLKPMMSQSRRIYEKLSKGGMPIPEEHYVHRVVQGKGNFIDRLLGGSKGSPGNVLSKTAPATKARTMMALEDEKGNRKLVAVKGESVNLIQRGVNGESLSKPVGKIEAGQKEGDRVVTINGKPWKLVQATTKEIEAGTDLRYYKNAAASVITSYLNLRKAERAYDFLESLKADPKFQDLAWTKGKDGSSVPPEGWAPTKLAQFQGYYFEPHVREVMDWYYDRIHHIPNAWEKIGRVLMTSIFYNPLLHIPNVGAAWFTEGGATRFNPANIPNAYRASARAIAAVKNLNDDYVKALEAGAPLQAYRPEAHQLQKLFFDHLGDKINSDAGFRKQMTELFGKQWNPYVVSHQMTWGSNDAMVLQAIYERMGKGESMQEAIRKVSEIIPDYRLPTRMFDSHTIASIFSNKNVAMFAPYHYGLLKSFAKMAEGAVKGDTNAYNRLIALALLTYVLYPAIDQLFKKASGDKNARMRRSGPATLVDNVQQVIQGKKSPTQALQSTITPAVHTKTAAELFFNRDFYTGNQIYNPQAPAGTIAKQVGRKVASTLGPADVALRAYGNKHDARKKAAWAQIGVTFPNPNSRHHH